MKEEKYFIINDCSDGIYIKQMNKELLLKLITKDKDGYNEFGDYELEFLDYIPNDYDGHFDKKENQIIIIKGEFVIPKIKTTVTEYEI